ncbi:helix-turn-helix domain-containing protein [Sulfitobacter sp. EhC04]|uniref:helix-turn-helix domain-containing protein n=1 Tax=Sulfitobacter sp. EhC04 TaxID=1849168 RepID=UPI0013734A67|nr:AraC family transcriptional regulator [Sulfitobacter sp. EhC04]
MKETAIIRNVGGTVRSTDVLATDSVRIEYIRRDSEGDFRWHFRNPQMCLFWFQEGAKMLCATISGKPVEKAFYGSDNFVLYPADVEINGEWTTGRKVDYAVVFFPADLVKAHLSKAVDKPMLAFRDVWLAESLNELWGQVANGAKTDHETASVWALKAMARLSYRLEDGNPTVGCDDAAMAVWQIRKLQAHIEDYLACKLTTDELAEVIGISRRHFTRVFTRTFATSPHRYLTERRINRAVTLLSETNMTVSEIALETGFGNSQHFASAFKGATGRTASRVRLDAHQARGLDAVA